MKYNKILWISIFSIFAVGLTLISIGGLMLFRSPRFVGENSRASSVSQCEAGLGEGSCGTSGK